jgi:hypothetical protein
MVTATDFRRETEAILVGEPTGARPVGYQELGTFDLPRSGLRPHCAIRRYRFSDTDAAAVFPDQRIDPDWNTDRSGHDNAIDWCLAHRAMGQRPDSLRAATRELSAAAKDGRLPEVTLTS